MRLNMSSLVKLGRGLDNTTDIVLAKLHTNSTLTLVISAQRLRGKQVTVAKVGQSAQAN